MLVDLPAPWFETNVQTSPTGEFHLTYARPTVKPYRGAVTALQRCADGSALRTETQIIVGDERESATDP